MRRARPAAARSRSAAAPATVTKISGSSSLSANALWRSRQHQDLVGVADRRHGHTPAHGSAQAANGGSVEVSADPAVPTSTASSAPSPI